MKGLTDSAENIFGQGYKKYIRNIFSDYVKVKSSIEGLKDYSDELRRTNDSLLTTKQNEIIKILTIMAYITFPLTLVTGIFGMNTRHTPVIGIDADFWIIAGFMLALTAGMFVVFKIKKWI